MNRTRTSPAEAVEDALRRFFADRRDEAAAIGPACAEAVAELESYVLRGGKRVRPTFAWLGWLGAGGDPDGATAQAVVRTGAALELFHAYGLIHDDVIDASLTRRGAPAAHVLFAERHRERCWNGDAQLFGTGTAILIGDLAQGWADDLIHGCELPAPAQARVAPVWSALRTEVLCGQLLDVSAEAAGAEDLDTPLRINQYKTASYTVERPCTSAPPSPAPTTPSSPPTAPSAATSASPSSCATTSWACSAPPRRPANPPATTSSRANAPSCSPPHCDTPTPRTPTPRNSCAPGSAPPHPRRTHRHAHRHHRRRSRRPHRTRHHPPHRPRPGHPRHQQRHPHAKEQLTAMAISATQRTS